MGRYTHTTEIEFHDLTTEVSFEFCVDWGTPERGNFGPVERYDPGSPPVASDILITAIDGASPDSFEPMFVKRVEELVTKLDLIGIADMQEAA